MKSLLSMVEPRAMGRRILVLRKLLGFEDGAHGHNLGLAVGDPETYGALAGDGGAMIRMP